MKRVTLIMATGNNDLPLGKHNVSCDVLPAHVSHLIDIIWMEICGCLEKHTGFGLTCINLHVSVHVANVSPIFTPFLAPFLVLTKS